jgi:hypothetical protein
VQLVVAALKSWAVDHYGYAGVVLDLAVCMANVSKSYSINPLAGNEPYVLPEP